MTKPDLDKINYEDLAYSKLLAYIALNNPYYEITKFHTLIAKKLEAAERNDIKRLMIFAPPRHGKTQLVSEFFPAWYLGRNPEHFIIFATYSHERAIDVGRKIRNQMTGTMHPVIFKDCAISPDSRSTTVMTTVQGGACYSLSIGGSFTGRGAHCFIIDDPIKSRFMAESELARSRLVDWFCGVAYQRLMPPALIILITTRWHYDDLAGYLLREKAHENWEVISLPAIAFEHDIIGRKAGDALWESRYPVESLMNIQKTIGSREWNAQYQQAPLPEEGGIVKLYWFKRFQRSERDNIIKDSTMIVISWDTSFKAKNVSDSSAYTVWAICDGKEGQNYFLLFANKVKLEYPLLRMKIARDARSWNSRCDKKIKILIEDQSSGQALIQDMRYSFRDLNTIAVQFKGDKAERMSEASTLIESGNVYLPMQDFGPRAGWLSEYELELMQFPYGPADDYVDSTSQFLQWVKKPHYKKSLVPLFWK